MDVPAAAVAVKAVQVWWSCRTGQRGSVELQPGSTGERDCDKLPNLAPARACPWPNAHCVPAMPPVMSMSTILANVMCG